MYRLLAREFPHGETTTRAKKITLLNHGSAFCKILEIAVIVFQLRVVAGTPKILSSWPR
jgi:hypothetical protein